MSHQLAKPYNWLIYRLIDPVLGDRLAQHATGRLLDIGCGTKPYADIIAPLVSEHVGLDHPDSPHDVSGVELRGTAYDIPSPDQSFDTVLCTDVLEHLEFPQTAVDEAFRMLRPGGVAIYTTPLFWHLHEEPRDFYRYTRHGLSHLFRHAGFEVTEILPLSGFVATFAQALCYFLWRFTRGGPLNLTKFLMWPIVQLVQLVGLVANRFDRSEAFTVEYLVVAHKPTASEPPRVTTAFLLGAERCGSTWLANVVDAHPAAELYMEPFADYVALFPEIPERNHYVDARSAQNLVEPLTSGYARLAEHKYRLLYERGSSVLLRRLDQMAITTASKLARFPGFQRWGTPATYQLLHLHLRRTPWELQRRKNATPDVYATKELRLNFKVPLLRQAFPDARYVVAIRHPAAQIDSVMRLMASGRLGELRRSLNTLDDAVLSHDRTREVASYLPPPLHDRATPAGLARWWFLNYLVLLGDLDATGAVYTVVQHEEIARAPHRVAQRVLEFLGLSASEGVTNYVDWSSSGASPAAEPVGTQRDDRQRALMAHPVGSHAAATAVAAVHGSLASGGLRHHVVDAYTPT